jgi:hypothetical protein
MIHSKRKKQGGGREWAGKRAREEQGKSKRGAREKHEKSKRRASAGEEQEGRAREEQEKRKRGIKRGLRGEQENDREGRKEEPRDQEPKRKRAKVISLIASLFPYIALQNSTKHSLKKLKNQKCQSNWQGSPVQHDQHSIPHSALSHP